MKKIVIVAGTRPEAIKLVPVYLELKKSLTLNPVLVSTGQHKEMLDQIFSFFEVTPDLQLDLMQFNQSLAQLTSLLFEHLDNALKNLAPDLIIVQGDTATAMVGAMLGFYNRIQVAHIEAGLRSNNKWAPFPEEINRKIVTLVADIHFAPTKHAYEKLTSESIEHIYLVGNTVIDSLLIGRKKIEGRLSLYKEKFIVANFSKKLILITVHRRESFGEGLYNIISAIEILAKSYPECEFIFPVHLNPNIKEPVYNKLGNFSNVHLLNPVQYDEMIFLMSHAYIILTDSGGIQEEGPSLNVPIIVLRDVTERPEGIQAGCAILGGTQKESIIGVFNMVFNDVTTYSSMQLAKNPYGDGSSSERIVSILSEWL